MRTVSRSRIGRVGTAAAKLLAAGPRGWWLLVEAQLAILSAAALVRHRPQGELIASFAAKYSEPSPGAGDVQAAQEVAVAIDRMARFGPGRPLCLVRSIALHRLLERRGIPGSRIHVGVQMNAATVFQAHAWVELMGQIVGDDPEYVRRFRPLSGLEQTVASAPIRAATA
jgi:hypothetical protein